MDAAFMTIILMMFSFIWLGFTRIVSVQRGLHCLGPLAGLAQWHVVLFVGNGALVARTFYDFALFEYCKYDMLRKQPLIDEPNLIPGLTQQDKDAMFMPDHLRNAALLAPVAGLLAAIIVISHALRFVRASMQRKLKAGSDIPWMTTAQENLILMVIAMPLVYIIMAMRSEIRALAVMTGSAWLPHQGEGADQWVSVQTLELGAYTSNLEVANFFQYITIFCLGRLCVKYLADAPSEYRSALTLAGLQGVYLYVAFGMLRSVVNLALSVLKARHAERAALITALQSKGLAFISPVFTVATLLCVFNMLVICRMADIKKRLGNANLKFQGTRFLVLVSQIQLQVLLGFCVGSSLDEAAEKYLPGQYQEMIHSWGFSTYRSQLLHSCLLCFECLAVVVFHLCVWSPQLDYNVREPELAKALLP